MAPLGLFGAFSTSQRVRGVMAASSWAGVSLNAFSGRQLTKTGLPSASSTISGYETQYGAGTMTSSPACTVHMKALKMICLPPVPTISSLGA
ncbi:hypothetical protein D3C81_1588300 [compost metagenome]